MELSEDSLLKPFSQMGGLPAPGEDLGGWYIYKADYDYRKDSSGLAPGEPLGSGYRLARGLTLLMAKK